jgi:16S rRNA (guanine1207-N2)-methyltransferase
LPNRDGRGPETYVFGTQDGLLSKDDFRQSELTLAEYVEVAPDDDVLVPDANYGVVGVVLAFRADRGETLMLESSARAADCCRSNAVRNDADNATVELAADVGDGRGNFDAVAHAPKPYQPTEVIKEKIAKGLDRLSPGGTYYLAGAKSDGVRRYEETLADLTGATERVTVTDGCHLYRAERPADYEPRSYVEDREFRATVGEYTCRFLTRPGLFSADELDAGTTALLEHATAEDGDRVLDVCCGYGAIGAFVGARTDCSIWATDDDAVATAYARRNLERNGVTPESVVTGDCLDAVSDLTFDTVLSNPPTHAGKDVTRKLFSGVRDVLELDGEFWLVANRVMNYDAKLSESFDFDAEVVAEVENYDVILARPA